MNELSDIYMRANQEKKPGELGVSKPTNSVDIIDKEEVLSEECQSDSLSL